MTNGTLVHKDNVIGKAYGVKIIDDNRFKAERIEFDQNCIVSGGHRGDYSYIDFGMQPSAIHMFLEDKALYGISIDKFLDASGNLDTLSVNKVECDCQVSMARMDGITTPEETKPGFWASIKRK